MPAAVSITSRDYTAAELRREASDEADVAHRILVLALVPEGKSRGEAATSGGMDRQTARPGVGTQFSVRHEPERNTIHAITKAGRLRAVVEDMPKMPPAAATMDLSADQEEETAVLHSFDCSVKRSPEARPACFALELGG